jgi:hypothetical protein
LLKAQSTNFLNCGFVSFVCLATAEESIAPADLGIDIGFLARQACTGGTGDFQGRQLKRKFKSTRCPSAAFIPPTTCGKIFRCLFSISLRERTLRHKASELHTSVEDRWKKG